MPSRSPTCFGHIAPSTTWRPSPRRCRWPSPPHRSPGRAILIGRHNANRLPRPTEFEIGGGVETHRLGGPASQALLLLRLDHKLMGQLDGKVAFITGVARGQGRSHALTLAREGADIIGLDLCAKPSTTAYAGATEEDLQETVRLVKEAGGGIIAEVADTRDYDQVKAVFDRGIEQFGRVDIVIPNAGICSGAKTWEISPQ